MVSTKRLWAKQLRYLPDTFKLIWAAGKGWVVAWGIALTVQSLLPVFNIYLLRNLIDQASLLIQTGWQSSALQPLIVIVAALGGVQLTSAVLRSIFERIRLVQADLVRDHISDLIQEKAITLDMSYYEQPQFLDLLHRVRFEARSRPLMLFESMGEFITSGLTLLGMMVLLASYSLFLPPILIISTLPALWVVLSYTRRLNQWRIQNTANERKTSYYENVMTELVYAPELRLFSLGTHYRQKYGVLRKQLRTERLKINSKKMLTDFIATGIAMLIAGGTLLWMGWRVVQGLATFGDLVAFYQIFQYGQNLMQSAIHNAGNIYQSVLFLHDLFEFFALEPRLFNQGSMSERMPLRKSICFENISYRYPGSTHYALKNFSFEIPAGQIVALVGENGTGKTTLMKLLCRFYDPEEGTVLWDGVDLRTIPLTTLQREISMMFQTPNHYQESAFHNIAIADLSANPTLAQVEAAARTAGADEMIRKLSSGYDTVLGKFFSGEELSPGQWQKLTLARTILRNASLIILDEPTSAMDAWAEMEWLSRIRKIAEGKTMIMITHRFTTAMKADQICVIHDNEIVEAGTHETLLAQGKRYAASWHAQMRQQKTES